MRLSRPPYAELGHLCSCCRRTRSQRSRSALRRPDGCSPMCAIFQGCGPRALPVGACMAELGTVAASWGTVLVSGSGVLVVGEVGAGLSNVLGFLCRKRGGYFSFYPHSPPPPTIATCCCASNRQGTTGRGAVTTGSLENLRTQHLSAPHTRDEPQICQPCTTGREPALCQAALP